jgi:hypothetical protein
VFKGESDIAQALVPEARVQRPSREREDLKDALREELGSRRLSGRLSNAREAYEAFVVD